MQTVAVARNAMATRFEIVLHGDDPVRLRAAAEEALDEIERLEAQLSLYQTTSAVAQINARAALESVRVTPELFQLLHRAQQINRETGGAFDITIAPLLRAWKLMGDHGAVPDEQTVAEARAKVGMHLVELNENDRSVHFARAGVMIDLGSIGKGYALDRAVDLLRETGITSALLHGGTSTVCALGAQPDGQSWRIAIEHPEKHRANSTATNQTHLATVALRDESLSVSAVWGKCFAADGKIYGHVIDPRRGAPTQAASLAAVVLPSATESDAFSTALLITGPTGHDTIQQLRPRMRTLVYAEEETGGRIVAHGIGA